MTALDLREPEPLRTTLCSAPVAYDLDESGTVETIELCTVHVEDEPCSEHPDGVGVLVNVRRPTGPPPGGFAHDPLAFIFGPGANPFASWSANSADWGSPWPGP